MPSPVEHPMNNDCGHHTPDYCVMGCGDAHMDDGLPEGAERSGCYEELYVCEDCIANGLDGPLARQWWAQHRLICKEGYVVKALEAKVREALRPYMGQVFTSEIEAEVVTRLNALLEL